MVSAQNVAGATISTPFDTDALFAELESATEDTFDLVVNAGMMARESLDQGRYIIGDLAVHVEAHYGEDTVGKFAEAINAPAASVREYRRVCRFWSRAVRPQLFEEMPQLSYSMLRTAARFKDTSIALDFLKECTDKDWKCEKAGAVASERLGGGGGAEMFKVLDITLDAQGIAMLRLGTEIPTEESKFRLVIYRYSEETK